MENAIIIPGALVLHRATSNAGIVIRLEENSGQVTPM